jgi:hypothetical protein
LKTKLSDFATTQIQWQTEPKPADFPIAGIAGARKSYGYLVLFSTRSNIPGAVSTPRTRGVLIRNGQVTMANGFDR